MERGVRPLSSFNAFKEGPGYTPTLMCLLTTDEYLIYIRTLG
jgi:hypothetical protein